MERIAAELKTAVDQRDGASAASSMRELIELIRAAARETPRTHSARAGETLRSRGSSAGETPRAHYPIAREAST